MAKLFTRAELLSSGMSYETIRWRVCTGRWLRLAPGVYSEAERPPNDFERRLAGEMRLGKPATGDLAATLHGMDGFRLPVDGDYANIARSAPHAALIESAASVDDIEWEQALEWCLRKRATTITDVEAALGVQRKGNGRIRRVLAHRPPDAPPTGSALETMAIQLIRRQPLIPTPERQVRVKHWLVDLAWPQLGVFLELDGEWHKGQPRYDAVRQTAVVAATGWLVGRFTWTDVVKNPRTTLRRVTDLMAAAEKMRRSVG